MELSASPPRLPGARIAGYRNSLPRSIRLLGLGERGGRIASAVAGRRYRNVEIVTDVRPLCWDELVADHPTNHPNMIIVVCGEGDERLFRLPQRKPAMPVTFVVLQDTSRTPETQETLAAQIRGLSDLFVTTSDEDYVGELIDNLAS